MADPNNPNVPANTDNSGWYVPQERPFPTLPDHQEFENKTDALFSISILDGLRNLINEMPLMYAEQLNIAGEDIIWLSRLTSGVRCPNWNESSDQDSQSKCPICYGTGWVGGYGNPRKLKMSFVPGKDDVEIQQLGLTITQKPSAWTINTNPIMKSFDLIVTYANERYIVVSATFTEKQGKRIYQELTLTRPDKFDVVYDVPVPTISGDMTKDFRAEIVIKVGAPSGRIAEFPATIVIDNYYWNPRTGMPPA